jgi:ribosomal protein S18 acetylase RimI-like enzyme
MNSLPAQNWDPERYSENARFVSDLGAPVVDLLAPQAQERILDVGCGDGALSIKLAEAGCDVIGIDASAEMVAAAQSRGLNAFVIDARALQFDAEFDAVFSVQFFSNGKDSDIVCLDDVYLNNQGAFHVVDVKGAVQGCVGIRLLSKDTAELTRLYVAKAYRGRGLGKMLCLAAIHDGRRLGYESLRLDTTSRSVASLSLFRELGFREIPRYHSDEFAEIFMEKTLRDA